MNGQSNRRSRWSYASQLLLYLFATALMIAGPQGPVHAAPAARTLHVRLQFEGYIRERIAGQWRINDVYLLVDQDTVIDETVAPAVVYAYVVVTATHLEGRPLHADTITVLRGASDGGPKLEISGPLVKQGSPENGRADWSISGTLVEVTSETKIIGQPAEGCLLTVLAEDRARVLYALEIQVVAETVRSVPVEFEGIISNLDPVLRFWMVDGSRVYYEDATEFLNGPPDVGQTIEVRAGLTGDGRLVASLVHVKSAPAEVRRTTYKSPASLATGGQGAYSPGSGGDQGAAAWSQPVTIAANQYYAATPTLVYASDGTAHSVWEEDGTLLHAIRSPGGQWSPPARVAVGVMPSLVVGRDNTLHLLFSHDFVDNDEIYYVNYRNGHWSLPINVSHTSGTSSQPAIALSASGALYAAWQDSTPGDWVIYYGQVDTTYWSSRPVPNARGQGPAIAVRPDGQLYAAWQAPRNPANPDDTDIFLAQSLPGYDWTLPVDVSDTAGSHSVGSTVVSPDGLAHVAWVESGRYIYFSFGSGLSWSTPQRVASGNTATQQVKLTTFASQFLFLSWIQDGTSIRASYELARSGEWAKPTPVADLPSVNRRDLAIGSKPGGEISVAWVQPSIDVPGLNFLYQSTHPSFVKPRSWLPLVIHDWVH